MQDVLWHEEHENSVNLAQEWNNLYQLQGNSMNRVSTQLENLEKSGNEKGISGKIKTIQAFF